MATVVVSVLFLIMMGNISGFCFIGRFREGRCSTNNLINEDMAKVDPLFVPGG